MKFHANAKGMIAEGFVGSIVDVPIKQSKVGVDARNIGPMLGHYRAFAG